MIKYTFKNTSIQVFLFEFIAKKITNPDMKQNIFKELYC